jgi:nucleotide-binding universal stress UspA family protein
VKKVLFAMVCTALLASCASKRAAIVESTISEAETLRALAKAKNLAVPEETESLIANARKQNDDRQTEKAFVLADEAVLRLQLSLLEQEQEALAAENKKAEESLIEANESLSNIRTVLHERKNKPKEQVIH